MSRRRRVTILATSSRAMKPLVKGRLSPVRPRPARRLLLRRRLPQPGRRSSDMEVMVDLETMGLDPDAAIVAIGATKFTLGEEPVSTFYANVDLGDCLSLGLTVSASTIMWWLQQEHAARAALQVDR